MLSRKFVEAFRMIHGIPREGYPAPAVKPSGTPPSGGSIGQSADDPRRSQHRFLFNKAELIRSASAACVEHPDDEARRQYLRGLADACHGTADEETARAIHVARCVIIATKER